MRKSLEKSKQRDAEVKKLQKMKSKQLHKIAESYGRGDDNFSAGRIPFCSFDIEKPAFREEVERVDEEEEHWEKGEKCWLEVVPDPKYSYRSSWLSLLPGSQDPLPTSRFPFLSMC